MIPGAEDCRHLPPAKLRRARVVGELKSSVESSREALDLTRTLRESAGQPACNGIDDRESWNLATREDVRPDRHLIGAQMVEDALVESFEAGREKRQGRLQCELLDKILVELPSAGRESDDSVCGCAAIDGVESRSNDVDAQDHTRAAAIRLVVHLPGPERSRVAVAEDAKVELASEYGSDRTPLPQPFEGARDEREDVESHDEER